MAKESLSSWAKKLRAFADDLPRQENEIKKALALEVGVNLINATPKDKGEASSNWMLAKGSPSRDVSASISPNGDPSFNRLGRILGTVKPGETLWFSNNVKHIIFLNQGWSKQAPAGYVEIAIKAGEALIAKQRIRYKV